MGSGKVKHLQVRFLWVQERVRARELQIVKCDTKDNLADLNTKHHGPEEFHRQLSRLPVRPIFGASLPKRALQLIISSLFGLEAGAADLALMQFPLELVKNGFVKRLLIASELLLLVLGLMMVVLLVLLLKGRIRIQFVGGEGESTSTTSTPTSSPTAPTTTTTTTTTTSTQPIPEEEVRVSSDATYDGSASQSTSRQEEKAVHSELRLRSSTATGSTPSIGSIQVPSQPLLFQGDATAAYMAWKHERIRTHYRSFTRDSLREILRGLRLSPSGLKNDLVERLLEEHGQRPALPLQQPPSSSSSPSVTVRA